MPTNLHKEALTYLTETLGDFRKCPRPKCKGCLISVWARYEDKGPINHEWECTSCSRVVKDPVYAEERRKQYEQRKRAREARQQQRNQQ